MSFSTLTAGLEAHRLDERYVGFIDGGDKLVSVTFGELYHRARGLLAHFRQRGIRPGDELIITTNNNLAFIDAFWACQFGGIVPVPIAPGVSAEQRHKLFRVYRQLENPFLYTDHQTGSRIRALSDQLGNVNEYDKLKSRTVLTEHITDLDQDTPLTDTGPEDVALIQFSSGSTSDPKGIVLTHRNLTANILDIHEATRLSDQDVGLSWMPLTHDMGLIGFHLAMVLRGASHHIMATEAFIRRPLLWLQSAWRERASLLCSPNFGYRLFLKAFERWKIDNLDLSHVRLIFNGAEPISASVCREFMDTLATHGLKRSAMMPVYGLAEASVAVSFPDLNDNYRTVRVLRRSAGLGEQIVESSGDDSIEIVSVGRPVDHCQLRIVDGDGKELAEERVGRIEIRGTNVTAGYYARPALDRSAHKHGDWLDTGDVGFVKDGRLYVTGRLKDVLFVHGQNFYAHDLENIACDLDDIDLGKVAVCAVTDVDELEQIVVFVLHFGAIEDFVPIDTAVRRIIGERAGIEITAVIPVDHIPKTTSGKLRRFALQQSYQAGDFDQVLTELRALRTDTVDHSGTTEMERRLLDICAESLDGLSLQPHDNFFEIGMNSLKLVEIHELLDRHFPAQLEVSDMFDHPTLAQLAEFLQTKQRRRNPS